MTRTILATGLTLLCWAGGANAEARHVRHHPAHHSPRHHHVASHRPVTGIPHAVWPAADRDDEHGAAAEKAPVGQKPERRETDD
jgi:hypothetical protein